MRKVLITGITGELSVATRQRLQMDNELQVKQISLRDGRWREADFRQFDSIVHIVGITPEKATGEDEYYRLNTELTRSLAFKAKNEGVRQFVYISSMAVYGITQSMNPKLGVITAETFCAPNSLYGKSKLMAELALQELEDEGFGVSILRVPSVYGRGKTEYLDQYMYLGNKLPFIPIVFPHNYKSAIYIENLVELLYMIVVNGHTGIVCPDDGAFSALDYCCALQPYKKKSRFIGKMMEIFGKNNERIIDYYGTICYDNSLTNMYNGMYRIYNLEESIKRTFDL